MNVRSQRSGENEIQESDGLHDQPPHTNAVEFLAMASRPMSASMT